MLEGAGIFPNSLPSPSFNENNMNTPELFKIMAHQGAERNGSNALTNKISHSGENVNTQN